MKLPNLKYEGISVGKFIKKYELDLNQGNFINWMKSNIEELNEVVEVIKEDDKKYNRILIVNDKKLYSLIKEGLHNINGYITTGEFIKKYELDLNQGNFTRWIIDNKDYLEDIVEIKKEENRTYNKICIIEDEKLFKIIKGDK